MVGAGDLRGTQNIKLSRRPRKTLAVSQLARATRSAQHTKSRTMGVVEGNWTEAVE
jgi:hypothetical protein